MNLPRLTALADRGRQLARHSANSGKMSSRSDWYRLTNADGDRAEIFIYDFIDDYGVNAGDFVRDLRTVTAKSIDLRINSGGGLVFDAVAIFSALRNHPATVDVTVDGIAASAASFIAMAGDTIAVEKPAKMMIHDAQGVAIGDASVMREMGELLNELSDTIAAIYADRAGGPVNRWREAMRATTWYSAADAVKAGLADWVAGDSKAPEDRRSQQIRARARVCLRG